MHNQFLLILKSECEAYPSGQAWIEALGSTLMTDMPYEHDPSFPKYLDIFQLQAPSCPTTNSGEYGNSTWIFFLQTPAMIWTKFRSVVLSQKVLRFDPFAELTMMAS